MNIFQKIKLVLSHPNEFFNKVRKEKGIKTSYKYFTGVLLISTILTVISQYSFRDINIKIIEKILNITLPIGETTLKNIIVNSVVSYISLLIFVFVIVAILHLWIKLFRGKSDYESTFKIYTYSSTPSLLFGWFPGIGMLVFFYDLVLLVIGTSTLHKISKKRSLVLYLIPLILYLVIIAILAIAVISLISLAASTPEGSELIKNYINF